MFSHGSRPPSNTIHIKLLPITVGPRIVRQTLEDDGRILDVRIDRHGTAYADAYVVFRSVTESKKCLVCVLYLFK